MAGHPEYLEQLAGFVCGLKLDDLEGETVDASRTVVLDTIGAIVAGSRLAENGKLSELAARYGVGHFLTWCNAGGMVPHEQVTRSMSLFMRECAGSVVVG